MSLLNGSKVMANFRASSSRCIIGNAILNENASGAILLKSVYVVLVGAGIDLSGKKACNAAGIVEWSFKLFLP